ncbi:FkbM family methyltransferase [Streptomyces syringium]|uniref:FkbM family methyltransferase n=1 Tax=Streptomyces syringium TaxID=76729 RepID=UPI00365A31E6
MSEQPGRPGQSAVECDLPDGRSVMGIHPMETATLWGEIAGDSPYARASAGLGPDDVILDIGAHIGLASMRFAEQAPGARILSFEPAPVTYACLADNVTRHVPTGTAFPQAVGGEAGTAELTFHPFNSSTSTLHADPEDDLRNFTAFVDNTEVPGDARELMLSAFGEKQTVTVDVTTVTAVVKEHGIERIGLLKIDVERGELEVLRGIDAGLWPRIQRVLLEVHDIDGRLGRIVAELAGLGFEVTVSQAPVFVGGSVFNLLAKRP